MKMETIKPGMTRRDLLKIFITKGGMFTGLYRTFTAGIGPTSKSTWNSRLLADPAGNETGA